MRTARRAAIACFMGLALFAPAGHAQDVERLSRYRPLLRYDSHERYHAQPVSRPYDEPRSLSADRVYGHVAREDHRTWLQYWLFYAYNPQDRGVLRTGRHEGDWELVQLRLGADGAPDLATLTQHSSAEGCSWGELDRVPVARGEAPVIYVANGSHANYSRPGTHDRPFPDPNDEADGRGRRGRPGVQVISSRQPSWTAWPGRWGGSRAGIVPGEQSSPHGPRFQEDGAWAAPASFHRSLARACGAPPPRRTWLTIAAAALVALAAAGVALALRRRLTA